MSSHLRRVLTSKTAPLCTAPATRLASTSTGGCHRHLIFAPTHLLRVPRYKITDANDPFGEKASLSEEGFYNRTISDINAQQLQDLSESEHIGDGVFSPSEEVVRMQVIKRSVQIARDPKAKKNNGEEGSDASSTAAAAIVDPLADLKLSMQGLSTEEQMVLLAERMTDEERRIASALPDGFTQWLNMSPAMRATMTSEYRYAERQNAKREHWANKSYGSYEDYIRKEVIGVTAEDLAEGGVAPSNSDNSNAASSSSSSSNSQTSAADEQAFEDDGEEEDSLSTMDPLAEVALPNLGNNGSTDAAASSPIPSSGADKTIGDADEIRRELQQQSSATESSSSSSPADTPAVVMFDPNVPYQLPATDPSLWNTEDVIAWLDCFAEEGIMDEEMIKTFRMVNVNGDMLLNKVMPPNLFKIMRKWHLHRSNPKTRHLAESLVVDTEMVQYTIYLCFPYCGQMS